MPVMKAFFVDTERTSVYRYKMPYLFNTSFGLKLSIPDVTKQIIGFMRGDLKRRYKIIIGTDSAALNDNRADFVSAIVIHRVGNGGCYFWRRVEMKSIHTLRDRIIQEVLISLEAAKELLLELKKNDCPASWDFEIHADIGENGETKAFIQEVVGMIRASNFEARTKPDSYAAAKVADRHV